MPPETPPSPVEPSAKSDATSPATDTTEETDPDDSAGRATVSVDSDSVAFSDLASAAYCPRQLYYRRRDTPSVPDDVTDVMNLAFRYPELRAMSSAELAEEPISVPPETFHERLDRLADRPDWDALADPPQRDVFVAGKDCHGIAYKILPGVADDTAQTEETATSDGVESVGTPDPPPVPVIVSPGEPHEHGVWGPQSVRAVAVAKALAWEREREIPRAFVEYPAHATVRSVRLTVRKTADYRRALRTARGIDGPPPRLRNSPKCEPCPYREQCGVETQSLRSRLGL